jgi:pimeloyl-ACP methyl ester carboxylesterase
MMRNAQRSVLAVLVILAALRTADAQGSPAATSTPPDSFITVNGVRLQYLDWGGKGEALLFLTCLGGTAGDFQPLATRFTDSFHVFGLTRRGQGKSDRPVTGYDTATLTQDIVAFLDAKNISRVTLVGYSLAGDELTELAGTQPQRVAKLVYLDAAYDLAENAELGRKAHLDLPAFTDDKPTLELIARSDEYKPDYSRIQAPALGFFVTYDDPPKNGVFDEATRKKLLAWWFEYGQRYRREQIERFQSGVKNSSVVELHGTIHGGFVFEEKQQAILIREMRRFLVQTSGR